MLILGQDGFTFSLQIQTLLEVFMLQGTINLHWFSRYFKWTRNWKQKLIFVRFCLLLYYLPRWDSFFLESNGNMVLSPGEPSLDPRPVGDMGSGIRLYDIYLPAYTFDISDVEFYFEISKQNKKWAEQVWDNMNGFETQLQHLKSSRNMNIEFLRCLLK